MGLVNDFLRKIGIYPKITSPMGDDYEDEPKVLGAQIADGSPATRNQEVQEFIDRVRKTKPQLKNTSDQILERLYEKHGGNSLLPSSPTPSPTMADNSSPTYISTADVDPEIDEFLNTRIFPITRKYEIPDAVAASQFAAEGRLEGLGASRNNYFNIAAFDNDLGRTQIFKTPEEGVEQYARHIAGQGSYPSEEHKRKFQKAYDLRHDPQKMLKEIETAGYAGDPATYAERAKNNFPSYSSFAMTTPEWNKYTKNQSGIGQPIRP